MKMIRAAAFAVLLSLTTPSAAYAATKATPFLPVADEAPPKLFVEAPIPGPLAVRGTAVVPYRTENIRILPVFGAGAAELSPRAGHLHVTVDDLPWHWADAAGDDTIVVAGLPAGQHKILVELATPEHKIIAAQTIRFVVPPTSRHGH